MKRFTIEIGTAKQSCHCCDRKLKTEPFVRCKSRIRNAWGSYQFLNTCFRCIKLQNKELNNMLRRKSVKENMFLYKLNN